MATFAITTNATSAGQALAAASTAVYFGGVIGPASLVVEASPDNVLAYVPVVVSNDISLLGKKEGGGGVAQCMLPDGWYVRVRSLNGDDTLDATVVIE
jgi:hypothetical protein